MTIRRWTLNEIGRAFDDCWSGLASDPPGWESMARALIRIGDEGDELEEDRLRDLLAEIQRLEIGSHDARSYIQGFICGAQWAHDRTSE
jgi:hypothetical protein